MFRVLRVFALFLAVFLSGGAFADGGFVCPTSQTYVSCDAGYYLSDCGSYRDGRTITSPAAGNSCKACPSATSSAYYECAGGKVCPKNMVKNEFTLKTTSLAANTTFSFNLSAAGVFYVKWGDTVVQKIDRTNNVTETSYSHTYKAAGVRTITISGQATAYNSSTGMPAISFKYNTKIASISGSLGAVFGTLADGSQPRFFQTFLGATNLSGSIPSTLFSGISGRPASHMFAGTFQNCSKLTSIPSNLFSGLQGGEINLFQSTFNGCSGLTSIPDGLFANVSGTPLTSLFDHTFNGCTKITSIPENLFGNLSGTLYSYAFRNTFNGCSLLTGRSAKINGKYVYEIWPDATTAQVGGMYSGATGLVDYPCIPTNYGGTGTGVCVDIVYDANGGTGNPPTSPIVCIYGQPCTVPENTYTYSGKIFGGWKRMVDGGILYPGPGQDILSGLTKAEVSARDSITLSAQWGNPIRTVTLNNTDMGGTGGTTEVYTSDGVVFYSDVAGTTAIKGISVPTKQNATYMGHYTTSATSGGVQCIGPSGEFTFESGCEVTSDTRWYARYQCNTGWTDAGTVISGICSKNITVNLNNLYATKKGTEILYARAGSGETFFDKNHTNVVSYITIPENVPVFTFDANGGTVDLLSGVTGNPDIAQVTGNSITLTPLAFNGFYSAKSGGTQYIDATGALTEAGRVAIAKSTENLTWYAQWNTRANIMSMPAPVRDGYLFSRWVGTFDNDGQTQTISVSAGQRLGVPTSAVVTAYWTPKCNEITLNPNAGTAGSITKLYKFTDSDDWYFDSKCTAPLQNLSSVIPSRVGYLFRGFYPQSDEEEYERDIVADYETRTPAVIDSYMIIPGWNTTSATTLYASWVKDCEVPNNGKCSVAIKQNGVQVDYTTSCAVGYTLGNDNTATPSCTANTYTISFNANGGTGGQSEAVDAIYNSRVPRINTTAPTRTGYTFMGWYDGADYTNSTQYYTAAGGAVRVWDKTEGATLYAGWKANTFSIRYNAGGGSGSAPSAPISCTYDGTCTAPANTYSKTGYEFVGWACMSGSGSCAKDVYAEGEDISRATAVNGDLIQLTAQWSQNAFTCLAGEYLPAGATVCETCPAGSYCTGGTFGYSAVVSQGVSACPMNSTSESGKSECTCDTGYTVDGTVNGATTTSGKNCEIIKVTCSAGTYLPKGATECTSCPTGSYCVGGTFGYNADEDQGLTVCPVPNNMNPLNATEAGFVIADLGDDRVLDSVDDCKVQYMFGSLDLSDPSELEGENKRGLYQVVCRYDANTGNYTSDCYGARWYCDSGYWSELKSAWEWTGDVDPTDGYAYQGATLQDVVNNVCKPVGQNYYSFGSLSCYGLPEEEQDQCEQDLRQQMGCSEGNLECMLNAMSVRHQCPDGGKTNTEYADSSADCYKSGLSCVVENGNGIQTCNYAQSTSAYDANCTTCTVEQCNTGYIVNGDACVPLTYTVKYNANGGTGAMSDDTHTYDIEKALTNNAFTNGTKQFLGWATSSSATTATYTNGQTVKNLSTTNGATVNLYAVWGDCTPCVAGTGATCELSAPLGVCTYVGACKTGYNTLVGGDTTTPSCTANTYTVSYAGNGNTGGSAPTAPTSCTYDSDCVAPVNTYSKTGYTFAGWACTGGGESCKGDIIAAGDSLKNVSTGSGITLTAQWTINSYTCSAGTYLPMGATECSTCLDGSYCVGGTFNYNVVASQGLSVCPSGYSDSDTGSDSESDCYRACTTSDVVNATSVSGRVYSDGLKACEATGCMTGYSVGELNLHEIIGTIAADSYDYSDNGFTVNYGALGSITGRGQCSSQGEPETSPTLPDNSGLYCHCILDSYTPLGGVAQKLSSPWVNDGAYLGCSETVCMDDCTASLVNPGYKSLFDYVPGMKQCVPNTYTISYAGNGNTGGSAPTAPTSCTYDSDCTAPANTYTKTGYTFAGWTCTGGGDSCNGNVIAAGGSLKNVSTGTAITLTAQWTNNSYTCSAGTYLPKGATECETCSAGSYCIGGTFAYSTAAAQGQSACPSGYGSSDAGSDSESDCYRACTTSDVVNATAVSGRVYSDGTNACEATGCVTGYSVMNIDTVDRQHYYDIDDDTFYVDYGVLGTITGHSQCSSLYSDTMGNFSPTLPDSSGAKCYCKLDSYTPLGGTSQALSGPWVYGDLGFVDDPISCDMLCVDQCSSEFAYNSEFGSAMLNSVRLKVAQCVPNTYTISYAGNDNTGGDAPSEPTSCTYDSDCTAPANTYSKTGYTFAGWACTGGGESCDGDIIAAGDSLKNVSTGSGITLTAQWTANVFNVAYDANGGTGDAPSEPTSCTYDSDCVAPVNTYSKTGYTFAGWACTGGGELCDGDIITAGDSLKNISTGSGITLTAQWTANVFTCNAGTYLPAGATECSTCSGGSYCVGGEYAYNADEDQGITACSTLADGFYPNSLAGADADVDCYTNAFSGAYVANANDASMTSCVAGTFAPEHTVNYGSTSSCTACATGAYSDAGASACVACQGGTTTTGVGQATCNATCANNNESVDTWAIAIWSSDNTVADVCVIDGCIVGSGYNENTCTECVAGMFSAGGVNACAVCAENTYSDAGAGECTACATEFGYANTGDDVESHAGEKSCKAVCDAGYYVATPGTACVEVGAGYYGAGGEVLFGDVSEERGQCDANLTTIGYGFGANEAEDCGRPFHAGDTVVYLRSAPRTLPALNVRIDEDTVLYGTMSTDISGRIKIKNGETIYSVVDDYQ